MNESVKKPANRIATFRIGLLALLVTCLVVKVLSSDIGEIVRGLLQNTLARIDSLGFWAPILFVLVYAVACVLLVPASFLTLGAGVIFGVVKGSLIVSVAATLGATCAFLVGRYLAHDWVRKRFEGSRRFAAIDHAVAEEGWKIVGLSRLSPIFPFFLLNYIFSLTRIRLRDYVIASWIGMIPGTTLYVYVGSLAGSLTALSSGETRERSTFEWTLYGVGLIATIVVTIYATRIASRALNRKIHIEYLPGND